MAKKKSSGDPSERVRKIGERVEVFEERLSPMQLEDVKTCIATLLDREDDLRDKLKQSAKVVKAELANVKRDMVRARTELATTRRRSEVQIEEHLTRRNEVIKVRVDTGELIGSRTATARELQEELPLSSGEGDGGEPGDDGFGD